MERYERQRYEMLVRVRNFGMTHRQHFPETSAGGKAFTVVAEAAAALEAHATAKLLTAEEGKKTKAAARNAVVERLAVIARTARELARTVPGADSVFRLPEGRSDVALITTARAFVREGQSRIERFVPLGMAGTFVAELQEVTDTFEQAVKGREAGRAGLAEARGGIKAALAKGADAVRTLDVIVSNTLEDNPVLVDVWKRERRVITKGKTTAASKTEAASATASPPQDALAKAS